MTWHEIVFTIIALIVGSIAGWKARGDVSKAECQKDYQAGLNEGRRTLWSDLYQRWVEWKSRK